MQTICKITPARRAGDAAWLSELVAQYQGRIQVVEGCKFAPPPIRKDRINPEYVLKRERLPHPRVIVRMIADLSTEMEDGVEVVRTAHQVAREMRRRGVPVSVANVELYARAHRIRLRDPKERRIPQVRRRGGTKQARDRAVLREEWT